MTDRIRRLIDIVVAIVVLAVGSPVLLAVAVGVRLTLGSPVLFRQQRLGIGGRPFTIVKFRTMRDPEPGREGSQFDAARITRFGRVLRLSSLDELAGFFNLLRGDITLVGPRPLPVRYWDRFVGDEYRRFQVRPGITGLAQVAGRNRLDWDERLALDVRYVETRSVIGDLRILLRTIPVVLSGTGVNQAGEHAPGATTMTELPAGRDRR